MNVCIFFYILVSNSVCCDLFKLHFLCVHNLLRKVFVDVKNISPMKAFFPCQLTGERLDPFYYIVWIFRSLPEIWAW